MTCPKKTANIFSSCLLFLLITLLLTGCQAGEQAAGSVAGNTAVNSWEDVPREYSAFKKFYESTMQSIRDTLQSGNFQTNFDYDNTRELPQISEQQAATGAVPFIRSYLIPVFEQSIPTAQEIIPRCEVRVARGEVEPVTFGLYALKDLQGIHVELGQWQNNEPGSFGIRRVECSPVRHGGSSRDLKWQSQPVRLWPLQTGELFEVRARHTLQFWGTLRVNPSAEAGRYTLPVKVLSGEKEIYTLELMVEVLPIDLPQVKAAYGVYEGDFISPLEMADLVDHGCNSMSMWGHYPKYDEQTGKLDMSDLNKYLRELKKAGLAHSWLWYVGTKSHLKFRMKDAMGEQGIRAVLQALDSGVRQGAYPENLSVTIDEAVVCNPNSTRGDMSQPGTTGNRWNDFVWLMEEMKQQAPSLKRFGVSLNRYDDAILHKGLIDILSCNGDLYKNGEWTENEGIGMYTYTSFNKGTYAAQSRYNAGFLPWSAGSEGTYCWAYKWSGGNPYNDFDAGHMDWILVYPGPEGQLISTPAWEAWREGVDDRRYVELYEQMARDGLVDGKLLDELRPSLMPESMLEETTVGDSQFGGIVGSHLVLEQARRKLQDAIIIAIDY